MLPRMLDLVPHVADFFRQDPFRALGVMCLACLAISMTTDFDLLAELGLVDVEARPEETAPIA
jgi:hypothetical protein